MLCATVAVLFSDREILGVFLTPAVSELEPSLNTQSCIKELLVVRDFCFLAIWAAGPVHKKKFGAYFEGGLFMFLGFIASALKNCILNFNFSF